MKKEPVPNILKRTKQYCPTCNKVTLHIPKLGLVRYNMKKCDKCNTANEFVE